MARVELRNVVKRFGKVLAVDHVSLRIEDKEFFSLLGPSGCGKTTTLRLIAGLEFPDEGEILIDDVVVNDLHPKDRDIAMVFQNYALYPHMTVFENIAFPLETRRKKLGLSKDDIRKRVVEIARFLGIEDLLDRYPYQLSGGQQQRVALARALVRKPKVWLLDEPLSNLDAKMRIMMRSELKKLQKTLGITAVYVTHDQVEAMGMSDRIAVMNKGKVLQVGTPDELYSRPADTFVATFIGAPPMNLIPCTLVEKQPFEYVVPDVFNNGLAGSGVVKTKHVLTCSELFEIPLAPEIADKVLNVKNILLGIRPEHMSLHRSKPDLNMGFFKARVDVVEPLGSELIVDIRMGDEFLKIRVPGYIDVQAGREYYVVIDLKRALLFDGSTGKLVV